MTKALRPLAAARIKGETTMPLATKALTVILLMLASFAGGWVMHGRVAAGQAAQQQIQQRDDALETQRLQARHMTRVSNAYTEDALHTERSAAAELGRLRHIAQAATGPAPQCAGRNDDPRPAAAVIHDETLRDLVALARDADATADKLRACQLALGPYAATSPEP